MPKRRNVEKSRRFRNKPQIIRRKDAGRCGRQDTRTPRKCPERISAETRTNFTTESNFIKHKLTRAEKAAGDFIFYFLFFRFSCSERRQKIKKI